MLEWYWVLLLMFGAFLLLMGTGLYVFVAFLGVAFFFIVLFTGGPPALGIFILGMRQSVSEFTLVAVMMYFLMGDLMFQSGVAQKMIDTLDLWFGRVPGRLSLMAVAAGTIFATLSGSMLASTALLGSSLMPEMTKRGYSKSMSMGPIMGAGGLAVMIPPSAGAIIIGAIGGASIGSLLVAIIIPGLIIAAIMGSYIVIRSRIQPSLAPSYEVPRVPLRIKLRDTVYYILPLTLVVFLVVGLLFLGVATPSEAAATGCLGTFILAFAYRKMNRAVLKKTVFTSVETGALVLTILVGAMAFSQVLAFSGATQGLTKFIVGVPLQPIIIIILTQIVIAILGMFITATSIMFICGPIFFPIAVALGFDPVWYAVIFLINTDIAEISPPFGMRLFVMKAVAPPGVTTAEVYRAALPYCFLHALAMVLVIAFPAIALWLPSVMR